MTTGHSPPTPPMLWLVPSFDFWLEKAAERHIDPYTMWSLRTGFRQFNYLERGPRVLDFLVELDEPASDSTPFGSSWAAGFGPEMPEVYREPMPGSTRTARHVTVRLPVVADDLPATAQAVARLMFAPGVRRVQIGFPRPDPAYVPGSAFPHVGPPAPLPPWPPKVLLGVLEDGCPFGHPSIAASPQRTRVAAIWNQTAVPDECPDRPPKPFGYGRERFRVELDALLARHAEGTGVDEAALYADPQSLQQPLPLRRSHGAAILTLFAGRRRDLPSHSPPRPRPDPDAPALDDLAVAPEDAATTAPIVVVQFPSEQVELAGARWLVVRALDGLRYVVGASTGFGGSPEKPLPLVVNISYGSLAGAHDRTALIETAMAELAAAHRSLAIVLAAGNSFGVSRASDTDDDTQRVPSGRHAVHALPPAGHALLRLCIPPSKAIETYLELWFDDLDLDPDAEQWLTPDDGVSVRLVSPLGDVLSCPAFPSIKFDGDSPKNTRAGVVCLPRVAQSLRRSMALVVVAATQISSSRVASPSGVWEVQVTNQGRRNLRLEAWVERDLIQGQVSRSQLARLIPIAGGDPAGVALNDDNTFNNVATGPEVFRVGSLVATGATVSPEVSDYSSAAGPGRPGPEFSAVADESPMAPGIRAAGVCSGTVVRINGTSVAAPQAARWIADRLADGQSLADIWAAINTAAPASARRGRIDV